MTTLITPETLPTLAAKIDSSDHTALDTETYGFGKRFKGHVRVISFACSIGRDIESFVVDVNDHDLEMLAEVVCNRTFDGWNANFDAHVLDNLFGHDCGITWYDGMIADALLYQGMSGFKFYHSLAWASDRYCGTTLTGKGTTQSSFTKDDPLTDEQIRYAAEDAEYTVKVCNFLRKELARLGLDKVAELELAARPFLDHMERSGLYVNWAGWEQVLAEKQARIDDKTNTLIADATGFGQETLFGTIEPLMNPASTKDVKRELNRVAEDAVRDYCEATYGVRRLLTDSDTVDAQALKQIDHPLASAILSFKGDKKVLSTYGKSLYRHVWDDGRMRPSYMQVCGTGTGRLSSRNPNAQNLTPLLKPYFVPESGNVFCYADLSQAELRLLAELSGDSVMREAFASGADIHEITAQQMFGVDMAGIKESEPGRYKELRALGKTLNFAVVYGLSGRSLATRLTIGRRDDAKKEGLSKDEISAIEVTPEEGYELLDQFREGYPSVAAWIDDRRSDVRHLQESHQTVDWKNSILLYTTMQEMGGSVTKFRKIRGHQPSGEQLAAFLDQYASREQLKRKGALYDWAMQFEAAVVLVSRDTPLVINAYTDSGRRRNFNVTMDQIYLSCVQIMLRSDKMTTVKTIMDCASQLGATLHPTMSNEEIFEVFKGRGRNAVSKKALIELCGEGRHPSVLDNLYGRALGDRIGSFTNAYVNNPIQGGVGDIALVAYDLLWRSIQENGWQDVVLPVQTVHDSITLECPESLGPQVAEMLQSCMESAMERFTPNVPAKADAAILTSLDEADAWQSSEESEEFDAL